MRITLQLIVCVLTFRPSSCNADSHARHAHHHRREQKHERHRQKQHDDSQEEMGLSAGGRFFKTAAGDPEERPVMRREAQKLHGHRAQVDASLADAAESAELEDFAVAKKAVAENRDMHETVGFSDDMLEELLRAESSPELAPELTEALAGKNIVQNPDFDEGSRNWNKHCPDERYSGHDDVTGIDCIQQGAWMGAPTSKNTSGYAWSIKGISQCYQKTRGGVFQDIFTTRNKHYEVSYHVIDANFDKREKDAAVPPVHFQVLSPTDRIIFDEAAVPTGSAINPVKGTWIFVGPYMFQAASETTRLFWFAGSTACPIIDTVAVREVDPPVELITTSTPDPTQAPTEPPTTSSVFTATETSSTTTTTTSTTTTSTTTLSTTTLSTTQAPPTTTETASQPLPTLSAVEQAAKAGQEAAALAKASGLTLREQAAAAGSAAAASALGSGLSPEEQALAAARAAALVIRSADGSNRQACEEAGKSAYIAGAIAGMTEEQLMEMAGKGAFQIFADQLSQDAIIECATFGAYAACKSAGMSEENQTACAGLAAIEAAQRLGVDEDGQAAAASRAVIAVQDAKPEVVTVKVKEIVAVPILVTEAPRTETTTTLLNVSQMDLVDAQKAIEEIQRKVDQQALDVKDDYDTAKSGTTHTTTSTLNLTHYLTDVHVTSAPLLRDTQKIRFEVDYDTVVAKNISLFLKECSAVLAPARCVDVKPGSAVVTLKADDADFLSQALVKIVQDGGLSLPSFGKLALQALLTTQAPTTTTQSLPEVCPDHTRAPRGNFVVYNLSTTAILHRCLGVELQEKAPDECCVAPGTSNLAGVTLQQLFYRRGGCPALAEAGLFATMNVKLQCNVDDTITYGEGNCGYGCTTCGSEAAYGEGCYKVMDVPGTIWFLKSEGCGCSGDKDVNQHVFGTLPPMDHPVSIEDVVAAGPEQVARALTKDRQKLAMSEEELRIQEKFISNAVNRLAGGKPLADAIFGMDTGEIPAKPDAQMLEHMTQNSGMAQFALNATVSILGKSLETISSGKPLADAIFGGDTSHWVQPHVSHSVTIPQAGATSGNQPPAFNPNADPVAEMKRLQDLYQQGLLSTPDHIAQGGQHPLVSMLPPDVLAAAATDAAARGLVDNPQAWRGNQISDQMAFGAVIQPQLAGGKYNMGVADPLPGYVQPGANAQATQLGQPVVSSVPSPGQGGQPVVNSALPPGQGGQPVVNSAPPPGQGGQVVVNSAPPPGQGGQPVVNSAPPPGQGGQVVVNSALPPGQGGQVVVSSAPPPGQGGQVVVNSAPPPGQEGQVVVSSTPPPGVGTHQSVVDQVSFVGDYATVVGANKDTFLQECSAKLDVAKCTDVNPGSIVVSMEAADATALKDVKSFVLENGLELPSFERLRVESVKVSSAADGTTPEPTQAEIVQAADQKKVVKAVGSVGELDLANPETNEQDTAFVDKMVDDANRLKQIESAGRSRRLPPEEEGTPAIFVLAGIAFCGLAGCLFSTSSTTKRQPPRVWTGKALLKPATRGASELHVSDTTGLRPGDEITIGREKVVVKGINPDGSVGLASAVAGTYKAGESFIDAPPAKKLVRPARENATLLYLSSVDSLEPKDVITIGDDRTQVQEVGFSVNIAARLAAAHEKGTALMKGDDKVATLTKGAPEGATELFISSIDGLAAGDALQLGGDMVSVRRTNMFVTIDPALEEAYPVGEEVDEVDDEMAFRIGAEDQEKEEEEEEEGEEGVEEAAQKSSAEDQEEGKEDVEEAL